MVEQPKNKDRIPFESIDGTTDVGAWKLPSMDQPGGTVRSAARDKKASKKESVSIENVSPNAKPRQLTAEGLHEITEAARKDGFQQGLKEGTEQGIREGTKAGEKAGTQRAYMEAKKDIEALQHQLRTLVNQLFDPMQKQDQYIENIIVDLVLRLSKQIIGEDVSANPMLILNIVQHVLSSIPKGTKNIRVFLNEQDATAVENLVPEKQREWTIQCDPNLDSGGCRIESDSSLADYSVEERLNVYLKKIHSLKDEPSSHALASPLPDPPDVHVHVQNTQEQPDVSLTEMDAQPEPSEKKADVSDANGVANEPTPSE